MTTDNRQLHHRVPCNACPWRKVAAQGYMGGHSVEGYADVVTDNQVPSCHLRDNGEEDPHTAFCVGALQCAANHAKRIDYPDHADAAKREVGRNPDVFTHPGDFYSYHTHGGVYVSRLMRAMGMGQSTTGATS